MLLAGPVPTAQAARITAPALHYKAVQADERVSAYWPTDPVQCDVILEGDIVEGDAAAIEREVAGILHGSSFTYFLCLRSGGGSVPEALKIAKFVRKTQRPSLATVIEDGETCASACALIFLAGNAPARVGAWPQRFLHPRGRLLYHSSRLDLSPFTDDALLAHLTAPTGDNRGLKGKIADLYKDGLRDVQSVISTFQGFTYQREVLGEPWVRQSLFLEMFAQDPNEWVCIDTVQKVGRWSIQVFGYQPPAAPTKEQHLNVCRNVFGWQSDDLEEMASIAESPDANFVVKSPPPATKIAGRNKESHRFDARYVLPYSTVYSSLSCVVEVSLRFGAKRLDDGAELRVFFMNGEVQASNVANSYPTSYFPATTLLPDLPGVRAAAKVTAGTAPERSFRRHPNSLMNGCSYKSLPKVGIDACQAACSTDSACQAYSYNRITRACDLKHTLTAMRLDPLWMSGAPSTGQSPERSSRPVTMANYDQKPEERVEGEILDVEKAVDSEACAQRCESDRTCMAVEYVHADEMCRRFSSVAGVRGASPDELAKPVEAQIKRQQ